MIEGQAFFAAGLLYDGIRDLQNAGSDEEEEEVVVCFICFSFVFLYPFVLWSLLGAKKIPLWGILGQQSGFLAS